MVVFSLNNKHYLRTASAHTFAPISHRASLTLLLSPLASLTASLTALITASLTALLTVSLPPFCLPRRRPRESWQRPTRATAAPTRTNLARLFARPRRRAPTCPRALALRTRPILPAPRAPTRRARALLRAAIASGALTAWQGRALAWRARRAPLQSQRAPRRATNVPPGRSRFTKLNTISPLLVAARFVSRSISILFYCRFFKNYFADLPLRSPKFVSPLLFLLWFCLGLHGPSDLCAVPRGLLPVRRRQRFGACLAGLFRVPRGLLQLGQRLRELRGVRRRHLQQRCADGLRRRVPKRLRGGEQTQHTQQASRTILVATPMFTFF